MALSVKDIINFVENWRSNNGLADNVKLSEKQIASFVSELQHQIEQMDFSVKEGTTIVGYSGYSNGEQAWKIAKQVSTVAGKGATYISDLPAGTLIGENRAKLVEALNEVVGKRNVEKIISSYDSSGNRISGGSCGFGEGLLSLDDFVSAKLMGETKGANSNLIVFVPEGVDQTKVFASTELEQIFENKTFSTINGIPKGQLQAIYNCGTADAVYDILTVNAKEAVGNTSTIEGQADALMKEMVFVGILIVNLSTH